MFNLTGKSLNCRSIIVSIETLHTTYMYIPLCMGWESQYLANKNYSVLINRAD